MNVADTVRPATTVSGDQSPAQAVDALDAAATYYAVVVHEGLPQSALHRVELTALDDVPLTDQLELLPALVVVGADDALDLDDLADLARLLERGRSTAVTVLEGDVVTGVLPADDLDQALPIEAVGAARMSGDPGVLARWYVCSTCRPMPSRRAPLDDSAPPRCPRNWLHGPMAPEN